MNKELIGSVLGPIGSLYASVENEILMSIGRYLSQHDSLIVDGSYIQWQAMMLQQLPFVSKEAQALLASLAGKTEAEINTILHEIGINVLNETDEQVEGLPTKPFDTEDKSHYAQVINAYALSALDKSNVIRGEMLRQTSMAYRRYVTNVTAQMLAGTKSYQQARDQAIRALVDQGIPAFTAKNGAKWSPEAYISLVMRQAITESTNFIQDARMREHGIDLVQISSHNGARPKCAPYQGKVFSLSGNHKKYKPLSSTSMGEPDGLFGINCGHYKVPFVEGLSKRHQDKLPNAEENDEMYKAMQGQRKLERDIRKLKAQEHILNEAGADTKQIKAKIKAKQAQMREYTKKHGLTRRYHREKIIRDGGAPEIDRTNRTGIEPPKLTRMRKELEGKSVITPPPIRPVDPIDPPQIKPVKPKAVKPPEPKAVIPPPPPPPTPVMPQQHTIGGTSIKKSDLNNAISTFKEKQSVKNTKTKVTHVAPYFEKTKTLEKAVEKAPENVLIHLYDTLSDPKFVIGRNAGGSYAGDSYFINMTDGDEAKRTMASHKYSTKQAKDVGAVFWHEFGHTVDTRYIDLLEGIDKDKYEKWKTTKGSKYLSTQFLKQPLLDDLADFENRVDDLFAEDMAKINNIEIGQARAMIEDIKHSNSAKYKGDKSMFVRKLFYGDRFNGVSDVFGGMTNNVYRGRWGHSSEYWKDQDNVPIEYFAHAYSVYVRAEYEDDPMAKEEIQAMKEYTPKAYNAFITLIEMISKELKKGAYKP